MAWGYNSHGAVGDGSFLNRSTPVAVANLTHITTLSAGAYNSIALCEDGSVWVWGENSWGQDGIDPIENTNTDQYVPFHMPGLDGLTIKSVSAGNLYNLAITNNGLVYAWGLNRWGELGRGEYTDGPNPIPQAVMNLNNAIAVAGNSAVLAIVPGIRPRWDVNGDHIIDIGDIAEIGIHWGETGTPGWIVDDVDLSGTIDIGDIAVVGIHWGETW
jgi:alpha-tubulin suppressor-like RCC1 family protein